MVADHSIVIAQVMIFGMIVGCSVHPIDPKPRADMSFAVFGTDIRYPTRYAFDVGLTRGFIDHEGRVIITPIKGASSFTEGLLRFIEEKSKLRGYMDVDGHVVISPRFVDGGPFSEGLALASLPGLMDPTANWPLVGYIDRHGEFVIPPQFRFGSPFKEGLAQVGSFADNVRRFINQKGDIALELPQYDNVSDFGQGLAWVRAGGKYGVINQQGEEVIALQYDRIKGDFSEGLLLVEQHDVWFFIDTQGQQAFPETFENAMPFTEDRARVEFGGKWGYIDRTGALVIEPIYDDPKAFSGGVACPGIIKEKKPHNKVETYWYGVIDPDGNMVLPFEYEILSGCRDGIVWARKGETFGYIDLSGRWIFLEHSAAP